MSPDTTPASATKRLSPTARRAQLLRAAADVLARAGVDGFSLEEVAREAGVAASLPRHYFDSSERLLVVAVLDVVERGTDPLLEGGRESVVDRLRRYTQVLAGDPWIHAIWMHSAQVHPEIDAEIGRRRRLLIERALGRKWGRLSRADRMRGVGWVGACDAIIAEWIAQGELDADVLLAYLTDASRRFGLGVA